MQALKDEDASLPRSAPVPLALLPLLLTLPFIYFPKVTESDTQPWVLGGTLFSFLFYWPAGTGRTARNWVVPVTGATLLCLAIYWFRAPELAFFIRFAAILATFVMLWHVADRGAACLIGPAVRITIVAWFAVGLYQTVAFRLGLPADFIGRFEPGRSGVPSLTAEPSFYGSLSVLHLMYLISENDRKKNLPYMALAVINVLFSGSMLSFLLFAVPAFRLPTPYKILGGLMVLLVLITGVDVLSSGFFGRVRDLNIGTIGPELLRADQSINWRFGHAYFTLVVNLYRELTYGSSADFMLEYNAWASRTNLYILHDSDTVLPSGGELLFRAGAAGALLLGLIVGTAWRSSTILYERVEKVAFVILCLCNPVSLANPFFVLYIQKRYVHR